MVLFIVKEKLGTTLIKAQSAQQAGAVEFF